MEIILLIPVAMLSFYAGLVVGAHRNDKKIFEEGVQFGRRLEKRRLNSFRQMGMFRPECEYLIDVEEQLK